MAVYGFSREMVFIKLLYTMGGLYSILYAVIPIWFFFKQEKLLTLLNKLIDIDEHFRKLKVYFSYHWDNLIAIILCVILFVSFTTHLFIPLSTYTSVEIEYAVFTLSVMICFNLMIEYLYIHYNVLVVIRIHSLNKLLQKVSFCNFEMEHMDTRNMYRVKVMQLLDDVANLHQKLCKVYDIIHEFSSITFASVILTSFAGLTFAFEIVTLDFGHEDAYLCFILHLTATLVYVVPLQLMSRVVNI